MPTGKWGPASPAHKCSYSDQQRNNKTLLNKTENLSVSKRELSKDKEDVDVHLEPT